MYIAVGPVAAHFLNGDKSELPTSRPHLPPPNAPEALFDLIGNDFAKSHIFAPVVPWHPLYVKGVQGPHLRANLLSVIDEGPHVEKWGKDSLGGAVEREASTTFGAAVEHLINLSGAELYPIQALADIELLVSMLPAHDAPEFSLFISAVIFSRRVETFGRPVLDGKNLIRERSLNVLHPLRL